jgi:L-lactate utilization protein LutB
MVSEEIALRARLEGGALEVVETDLGEYIVQMRNEGPSHLIAPAIHVGASDVAALFRERHRQFGTERDLSTPESLVAEARGVLREKFLAAEVGITGANFLVASTGSAIVVTNEGNADLTMSLPKVHIVLASIDKVVPTLPMRSCCCACWRARPRARSSPHTRRWRRVPAAPGMSMVRRNATSCCSTTAAPSCCAPICAKCCAASAVARA